MKFETLGKKGNKVFSIVLIMAVVLVITLFISTSLAKYKISKSIKIVEGKVSYNLSDLNVVAIKLENEDTGVYENTDAIPESGYTLNTTESYCEVNGVKDTTISMEYKAGGVYIKVNRKGTKCYLYFDVYIPNASDVILANKTISTRNDFTVSLMNDTTGTIYKGQDDDGDTYYYAGAPTDNWFKFADYYWRIIRVNGDGTVRLIYNGTSTTTTGTNTLRGTSVFNSSTNNNAYVGYMYKTGSVHGLGTGSVVKSSLDSWYSSKLINFVDYIDEEAGFCGDRSPYTCSDYTCADAKSGGGTGTTITYYGGYVRIKKDEVPSFKCENSSDLYTISSSSQGNKALTYPVGLITIDEVIFAGGVAGSIDDVDNNFYLYNNQNYWTMSPYEYSGAQSYVFGLDSMGNYGGMAVTSERGIRPVINLRSNLELTGTGTSADPYQVS